MKAKICCLLSSLLLWLVPGLGLTGCATTIGDTVRPVEIEAYAHGERFLVGVLAFSDKSQAPEMAGLGSAFSGELISQLQQYGRYRLIESERIQTLLETQAFQLSGAVDAESVQQVGKLLGVEALCITTIESFTYTEERTTALIAWFDTQRVELSVNSRIVAVETGEVLATASSQVTHGRRKWVAFGFLKLGALVEPEVLRDEAMALSIQELAAGLSEGAPRK